MTGGRFLVNGLVHRHATDDQCLPTESMAGHRAHRLLAMLQNALAFGYSEIEPHPEPLKVNYELS